MSGTGLDIGSIAQAELVVRPSDTASVIGLSPDDRFPAVFATSRMIALMEVAAARAMTNALGEDQLSVGVSVQITHTAASPVGSRVRAMATFLGQDGKLFHFRVEAFDGAGQVGGGTHSRAIVNAERLLTGAARRLDAQNMSATIGG